MSLPTTPQPSPASPQIARVSELDSSFRAHVEASQKLGAQLVALQEDHARQEEERKEEVREYEEFLGKATSPRTQHQHQQHQMDANDNNIATISGSNQTTEKESRPFRSEPQTGIGSASTLHTPPREGGRKVLTPSNKQQTSPTEGVLSPQIEGAPRAVLSTEKEKAGLEDITASPELTTVPSATDSEKLDLTKYQVNVELPTGSEDSAEDILSESDLHDVRELAGTLGGGGTGTNPARVLAVHSDCRPMKLSDHSAAAGALKSFDAFKRVLEAQQLTHDDSGAIAATVEPLSVADLTARNSQAYREAPKTLNRLNSLDHAVTKRLKKQKHHRRNSSKFSSGGSDYARAHPLVEPLHQVDKLNLAELIDRKKGRGVELHKSASISRALYDDVCRMLSRCHSRLNEREEDLKLAGQIGEAILKENNELEQMVAERSTQYAEVLEKLETRDATIQELQTQLTNLTQINKDLLDSQAEGQSSFHQQRNASRVGGGAEGEPNSARSVSSNTSSGGSNSLMSPSSGSIASSISSPLPPATPLDLSAGRQSSVYSAAGDQTDYQSSSISTIASSPRDIETLVQKLAEFLGNEIGQTNTNGAAAGSPKTGLLLSSPSNNGPMEGELNHNRDVFSLQLNSPQSSNGYIIQTGENHKKQSSLVPSMTDLSCTLVSDLSMLQRKLKKERRHVELERASWSNMVAGLEKDLHLEKEKVKEMEEQIESVTKLQSQLNEAQQQLTLATTQHNEREIAWQVDTRLKIQQVKKANELLVQRLDEELQEQRKENEQLIARRNEASRTIQAWEEQLTQAKLDLSNKESELNQVKQDQTRLKNELSQVQQDLQAQQESNVTLTSLLSQLRDELERQEEETQTHIQQMSTKELEQESKIQELHARLHETKAELQRTEQDGLNQMKLHITQLESIKLTHEKKLQTVVKKHEQEIEDLEREHQLALAELEAQHSQHLSDALAEQERSLIAESEEELRLIQATLRTQMESVRSAKALQLPELSPMVTDVDTDVQSLSREDDGEDDDIALRNIEWSPAAGFRPNERSGAGDSTVPGESPETIVHTTDDQVILNVCLKNLVSPSKQRSPLQHQQPSSTRSSPHVLSPPLESFAMNLSTPLSSRRSARGSVPTPKALASSPIVKKECKNMSAQTDSAAELTPVAAEPFEPVLVQIVIDVITASPRDESPPPVISLANTLLMVPETPSILTHYLTPASSSSSSARGGMPPRASPGSRAYPMHSPLPGAARGMSQTSSQAFQQSDHGHKSHVAFHATLHTPSSAGGNSISNSSTSSPLHSARSLTNHQQQSQLESSNQHRLALLSSVGKVLSIVTGGSPMNTKVGNTPLLPVGKTPVPNTPEFSPAVIAALAMARTPVIKAATVAGGKTQQIQAQKQQDGSIYVLPVPNFPLTPSDQLQLAYLYRYMYATWIQSFDWLDSCVTSKPALWIEDRVSGHCFSCQKHWTVLSRRHHCRLCGGLFCGTCSRYRVDLDKFSMEQVRCCLRCFGASQSMTMSNSLSLWEEPGTMIPPPERTWIGMRQGAKEDLLSPKATELASTTSVGSASASSSSTSSESRSSATQNNPNGSRYDRANADGLSSDEESDEDLDPDSSDLDSDGESDREYARDMQQLKQNQQHLQKIGTNEANVPQ